MDKWQIKYNEERKKVEELKDLLNRLHSETRYRISKDDVRTERPSHELYNEVENMLDLNKYCEDRKSVV